MTLFKRVGISCVLLLVSLSACSSDTLLSGARWQASGLQHHSIRTLAVDPNNTQRLYASDAQGNIFVSSDAAQHWMERSINVPLPNAIHALSFDTTGKKLYAATDQGLFVSTDGSQHWNVISTQKPGVAIKHLPPDSYTALAFDPDAPHIVYVGTARHGVFTSIDDGISWSALSLPPGAAVNGLAFDPQLRQIWAATSLGVYRSVGVLWQAFNKGLPANIRINTVVPASVGGGAKDLIYAGTNHGFFRSQNGGQQWTTSSESLSGTSVHSIFVDFRSTNASTIYVATSAGAFRSDDSGQNWRGIASGLPRNEPVYALVLGASNPSQLYAATDGIYLFPGNSGGFNPIRLLPFVLVGFFFYMLYRFARQSRGSRREMLKPEQIIGTSTPES